MSDANTRAEWLAVRVAAARSAIHSARAGDPMSVAMRTRPTTATGTRLGDALPAALRAEVAALRAAGLDVHVSPEPPPPPPRPARVLVASDVERLDVRDPRRTLYQYQLTYSRLGQPIPPGLVGNLRTAARDDLRRRRVSLRGE